MKICWWTNFRTANETALVDGLKRRGVDVVVCYFSEYDDYRRSIGWTPRDAGEGEFLVRSVGDARRKIGDFTERIQVVPSYADGISWRLMAWCILHRKPWVASLERSRNGWKGWPVRKAFAMLADTFARKVFCIGTAAMEQFAKLGVRREKLVWTAYAMPRVQAGDAAVAHDGEAGVRFAFVGALTERKAVDVLAAAFGKVRSSHSSATLKVVGDGPLKSVFDGMDGVTIVGAVAPDQVNRAIAGCGVIVLPSRYDPWGVALAEGACLGMAMIATSGVGAAEIIRESGDGANGMVVPPGDVDALAEAMGRYAGNPALVAAHGRNARIAAASLDADVLAEHVESELRERGPIQG